MSKCLIILVFNISFPFVRLTSIPSGVLQAGRGLGKDSRIAVRHCRSSDHRPPRSGYRVELQLLLPPGDGPRGHAVSELQSRHKLSLSPRHTR